jgi:hypothetical protein
LEAAAADEAGVKRRKLTPHQKRRQRADEAKAQAAAAAEPIVDEIEPDTESDLDI